MLNTKEKEVEKVAEDYLLEVRDVTKRFGNVTALDKVRFDVKKAEIHVLCGENGAGKSTLMNVLGGIYPKGTYEGEFLFEGNVCHFRDIKDSEAKGIAFIHQELALIPSLSIAENIFMGNEQGRNGIVNWDTTRQEAVKLMEEVGLKENPERLIRDIGVGRQQLVEICKALSKKAKLLILDEPTSALNEEESDALLELLVEFKKQGLTSILITHKLHEITKVADRITIIRDGKTIETLEVVDNNISEDRIIKGMVGREMSNRFPSRETHIGDVKFEVKDWNVFDPLNDSKQIIHNVNFHVKKGEVLGIAGLMGAGRTELAMSIFGHSYGKKISGKLYKDGKEITLKSVASAVKQGVGYVSEDRRVYGMIGIQSIKNNMTLPNLSKFVSGLSINENEEIKEANKYKDKLHIKARSVDQAIDKLSGGNAQKVIFSKWVMSGADVLFLDEPTRGIDVMAKYEIYEIINEIVGEGCSVVLISSDMTELIGMCDRIYVMSGGRMVGELFDDEIEQEKIMACILKAEEVS